MPPTRYGVAAIWALLPTAFSVAYEYEPRGIESLSPWLPPLCAMVLFLTLESAVRRRRLLWALIPLTVAAAAMWWRYMAGLLAWGEATPAVNGGMPTIVLAAMVIAGCNSGRRARRRDLEQGDPDREDAAQEARR